MLTYLARSFMVLGLGCFALAAWDDPAHPEPYVPPGSECPLGTENPLGEGCCCVRASWTPPPSGSCFAMCEQVSACNGGDQTSKVWPEKQSGACIPSGDPQTQCPNRFPYKRIPYFICMVVDSCPGGLVTCEWWEMENLGGYPEGGLFDCTSTADVCPG